MDASETESEHNDDMKSEANDSDDENKNVSSYETEYIEVI